MTSDKSNINLIFGKNLKLYRKKKKMTQEALGEIVGVSAKYIGNIECGISFPSSGVLGQLSIALDVPAYLFFIPEETTIENPYDSYVSKEAIKKELIKKITNLLNEL